MVVGATPFSLMYDDEVVVPLELDIPSLHVSLDCFISDEDKRKMRLAQIEALDEKKVNTLEHLRLYQFRVKRAYSKKK